MKLISWNVNGLRACLKKGFEDTFNQLDADVFCGVGEEGLQEVACSREGRAQQHDHDRPGQTELEHDAHGQHIFAPAQ